MASYRETHSEEGVELQRPALQPPRFTLATMMCGVIALSVLFAAMTAAGPIGGFALLLLVLAILAHVAGNAVGTRLRRYGNVPAEDVGDAPHAETRRAETRRAQARRAQAHGDGPYQPTPASTLSQRSQVTRTMLVFTATGAAALGGCGGALLIFFTWRQLNVPTAVVAVASPTVLGGLLGFMISSFTQTAGGAWRQASASYRDEKLAKRAAAIPAGSER